MNSTSSVVETTLHRFANASPPAVAGSVVMGSALWYGVSKWLSPRQGQTPSSEGPIRVGVLGAGAVGVIAGMKLLPEKYSESTPNLDIEKIFLVGRATLKNALQESQGKVEIHENFGSGKRTHFDLYQRPDVQVTEDVEVLKDCQVVLVGVKTVATRSVAEQLAAVLPNDSKTTVLSLQNGVGNAQVLRDILHRDGSHPNVEVLTTVVTIPAEWEEGTTKFHMNMKAGITVEPPSSTTAPHAERVDTLVRSWTHQSMPSQATEKIHLAKCLKLLTNLINPVNAVAGCPVRQQFPDRDHRLVLAAAIEEGAHVLSHPQNSHQLGLDHIFGAAFLIRVVCGNLLPTMFRSLPDGFWIWFLSRPTIGPNYKSSMLQDLERRRPKTEVDDLSGAVVSMAESTDIQVPVNAALVRMIRQAEQDGKGSPCLSGKDFLRQLGLEKSTKYEVE